ncbi:PREDICTED: probable serine protease EDA2 isoform X2 [Tarenaya hassleriana]|uniref:probable serine protease EDA2 isoform X2 n=1 Tax=Tarenaya hassleriana TaxID=28532 RepID=UPI00053C7F54|nr:PREDICTED: probable serine protease EDA2 isoform X2 [Tarenaya hassleriana]
MAMSPENFFTALFTFTVLLSASALSHGSVPPRTLSHGLSTSGYYLTSDELWFNQTLDHYSPYDHRKFRQRYYEFLDYFRAPDGPIFLRICGEGPCNGIPNDYLGVLAKKFEAAVVSLEHRYYGKSSPFNSLATENLRYLSSKQALFDLAAFRRYYQDSMDVRLNRSSGFDNPWFFFGTSYPGALSAWFRLKFPHLTCGSLASSAVVRAVYEFPEFDQQIGESAGPECKAVLQETNELLEQMLKVNGKAVKELFNASELDIDADFLYFIADAAVMADSGSDLVEAYAKYVKEFCMGVFGLSAKTYSRKHLRETAVTKDSADRLWWFQVCTEVAYFQVAPANDSVRSQQVNTEYHLDVCRSLFGKGVYPEVDATNLYYGGDKIVATKIIFTNGSQDPWRHASKQTSSPDLPSYIITCHNCGHGTDLRGCPQSPLVIEGSAKNCSSPDAVKKVRQQMVEHIDLWLSECRGQRRSSM